MRYIVAFVEAFAQAVGLSPTLVSGVRRLAVAAAYYGLAAGVSYAVSQVADVGLPVWAIGIVGAGLQAADKALRSRTGG